MTTRSEPLLSVVIPTYNLAPYIGDALRSLQAQQLTDFEAIVVDDCSTDDTADIAEEIARGDDRFRVRRVERSGVPGTGRNRGIDEAQGEYLTFFDGDDLVPREAYAAMVGTLAETGSDLAASNARRFDTTSVWQSWSHGRIFGTTRLGTSIRDLPALAGDRMPWNKVYRRSFWDTAGLRFPDILYSDYPVSLAAHLRATKVDVHDGAYYYWRERGHGDASITQQHWEIANLTDRVTSAELVSGIVDAEGPFTRPVVTDYLTHSDVEAVARSLVQHPDRQDVVFGLADRLLDAIGDDAIDALSPRSRAIIHFLRARDARRVGLLVDAGRDIVTPLPAVRRRGRWYQQLPTLDDRRSKAPRELHVLPDDYPPLTATVLESSWRRQRLHLVLGLELGGIALDRRTEVALALHGPDGEVVPLDVRLDDRHLGALATHSLLTADVALTDLADRPAGTWTFEITVRHRRIERTARVSGRGNGPHLWLGSRAHAGRWYAARQGEDGYGIAVRRRPRLFADGAAVIGDQVELEGLLLGPTDGEVHLELRHRGGRVDRVPVALEPAEGGSGQRFRARFAPAELLAGADPLPTEELVTAEPRLVVDGKERRIRTHPRFTGATARHGDRLVMVTRLGPDSLAIGHRPARLELDAVTQEASGFLRLTTAGTSASSPAHAAVVLRCWPTPSACLDLLGTEEIVDGVLSHRFDLADLVRRSTGTNESAGLPAYHRLAWEVVTPDGRPVVLRHDHGRDLPTPQHLDGRTVTVELAWSATLKVVVT